VGYVSKSGHDHWTCISKWTEALTEAKPLSGKGRTIEYGAHNSHVYVNTSSCRTAIFSVLRHSMRMIPKRAQC